MDSLVDELLANFSEMVADQCLPETLTVNNTLAEAAAIPSVREEQEQLDQKQGPDAAGKQGATGGTGQTSAWAVCHHSTPATTGSAVVSHSSAVRSFKAETGPTQSISSSKHVQ